MKPLFTILIFAIFSFTVYAAENIGQPKSKPKSDRFDAACNSPSSSVDLDINNVRTKMLGGGDMWWDLSNAKYEVPKGQGKHIIFAGSLWIGGIDAGKQLKIAAQTYRQNNANDFWAGPLDGAGSTNSTICNKWNDHFEMTKAEVDAFKTNSSNITIAILEWPAKNNPFNINVGSRDLAPFIDVNGDGNYNPSSDGDYPDISGDQAIWWIFNDNGNTHNETGGVPIGIEVHAEAFGRATADAFNDMTFYRYKVLNRSSSTLYNTYIGQFVDPDLGCHLDDYVGCDVSRDLGFCYNGDAIDETCGINNVKGYNPIMPAMGLKFLETPNDDYGNRLGLTVFVSYNNDLSVSGNPEVAGDFYNYLIGRWKDNSDMTYGGVGFGGAVPTKYMYPGVPCDTSQWSEQTLGHTPGDRRFLLSSGPFTLTAGELIQMSFVVLFASDASANPCTPLGNIYTMADDAQDYFTDFVSVKENEKFNYYSNNTAVIYPNPVVDIATIELNSSNKRIESVRIFDINGRLVTSFEGLNTPSFEFNSLQ
ncbi:MAG: T9SS type A sorting domain-containing protein, partial [Bacteroidetes bacterium]|nr:T9SS type A sorting domain-containing protein [Bacteroidota bacterium]